MSKYCVCIYICIFVFVIFDERNVHVRGICFALSLRIKKENLSNILKSISSFCVIFYEGISKMHPRFCQVGQVGQQYF